MLSDGVPLAAVAVHLVRLPFLRLRRAGVPSIISPLSFHSYLNHCRPFCHSYSPPPLPLQISTNCASTARRRCARAPEQSLAAAGVRDRGGVAFAELEPTQKSVETMRKFSEQYARKSGTYFCVDKSVTAVVIKNSRGEADVVAENPRETPNGLSEEDDQVHLNHILPSL